MQPYPYLRPSFIEVEASDRRDDTNAIEAAAEKGVGADARGGVAFDSIGKHAADGAFFAWNSVLKQFYSSKERLVSGYNVQLLS